MSESLSRDALIEQATRALHADHCCNGDDTGCAYPDEMGADQYQARIVLNATLRAVADDLEVLYEGFLDPDWAAGVYVAAEHVRDLLKKGQDQ